LKRAFSEPDLLSFDSGYVSSDSYPNLSQDAKIFIALFGSTYCCEQLFSRIKKNKNEIKQHLTASLHISISTVGADIDYLCEQKQCHISH